MRHDASANAECTLHRFGGVTRRSFLKTAGLVAGGTALLGGASLQAIADEPAAAAAAAADERICRGVCRPNCFGCCHLNVHVRDGKIVKTSRAPYNDERYSRICQRGLSHVQRIYDPGRLQYPMRRVEGTARGAGEWERISWDEAIDELAKHIKEDQAKYGPQALALYSGTSSVQAFGYNMYSRLWSLLKPCVISYAVDMGTLYGTNRMTGPMSNLWEGNEAADMVNAKTIVFWASNVTDSQRWRRWLDANVANGYDTQMPETARTSTFHQRWAEFFSHPKRNSALRYILFAVAVYLLAFSIALARTAQLGTSPIAALPNVCSYVFAPITIGQFQILMNLLMVFGQIILNRSFRRPVEFFQMVMAVFMGLLVDLNVFLLQGLPIGGYAGAWAWTALSIVLLALGVSLELLADAIMLPGEGIVLSITVVSQKPFHRCKVAFDVACIIAAAALSFAVLGGLVGVREGTVATAIFTGPVVKVMNRLLKPLRRWIPPKPATARS